MKFPSGAPYAGHIGLQQEHLNRFQTENPATTFKIVLIATLSITKDHLSGPRLRHRPALSWLHRDRARSDSAGVRSEGKKDRERRGCGTNSCIYNRNVLISHFHRQETYEQKQSPQIYSTKLYTEFDRDSENIKTSTTYFLLQEAQT